MVANSVNAQVGAAIATVLKRRGRTMAWLSRRSGIPYSTVKRIVSGTARMDTETIAVVACALGVPVAELLADIPEEN